MFIELVNEVSARPFENEIRCRRPSVEIDGAGCVHLEKIAHKTICRDGVDGHRSVSVTVIVEGVSVVGKIAEIGVRFVFNEEKVPGHPKTHGAMESEPKGKETDPADNQEARRQGDDGKHVAESEDDAVKEMVAHGGVF